VREGSYEGRLERGEGKRKDEKRGKHDKNEGKKEA
jgi:hypothetical protein